MWVSIRILEVTQERSGDQDMTENAGGCAEPPDMPKELHRKALRSYPLLTNLPIGLLTREPSLQGWVRGVAQENKALKRTLQLDHLTAS